MKPDLHGSRVVLRSIQMDDSDDLFEIYGDIQTMEFASDPFFPSKDTIFQMLESVVQLEKSGESLEWAVLEQSTNKVIGTCGYIVLVIAVIRARLDAYLIHHIGDKVICLKLSVYYFLMQNLWALKNCMQTLMKVTFGLKLCLKN